MTDINSSLVHCAEYGESTRRLWGHDLGGVTPQRCILRGESTTVALMRLPDMLSDGLTADIFRDDVEQIRTCMIPGA